MHDLEKDLPLQNLTGWTIAFDLDGTLVDTAPDLIAALNVVLVEQGVPPAPIAAVRLLVGHGLRGMLLRAYHLAGLTISDAEIKALMPRLLAVYIDRIARESRPFPGCVEALAALRARGAALAVCTNKAIGLTRTLLSEIDMSRHFDALVGGDELPTKKPDPAMLLEAIARAGGDPARAIMVGDASPDVGAAKAAGVPCIVLSFGYNDVPAAELGGDLLIDHYDDLASAISRLAASCRPQPESL